MNALAIHAGPKAMAHLQKHGLRAQDIAVVPGAAGGPKSLILQKLDQWLFGSWLPSAPRERSLIGASIGAWRMAAACHADPVAAIERLGDLYCGQCYPPGPTAELVTRTCEQVVRQVVGDQAAHIISHPHYRLHILASRGRRLLQWPRHNMAITSGFGMAALGNIMARSRLAAHFGRVVIGDQRDPVFWLKAKFDEFDTRFAPLTEENLVPSLLASGTLPFLMAPVRAIPRAPRGTYWDGGLIDYHLALPYSRLAGNPDGGLVLYPHFTRDLIPGWLDKGLRWRRMDRGAHRDWIDNLLLISPSNTFLQTLSRGKLPDRSDFGYYGERHDLRMLNWKLAISEGARLRDELAEFIEKPDMSRVQPL